MKKYLIFLSLFLLSCTTYYSTSESTYTPRTYYSSYFRNFYNMNNCGTTVFFNNYGSSYIPYSPYGLYNGPYGYIQYNNHLYGHTPYYIHNQYVPTYTHSNGPRGRSTNTPRTEVPRNQSYVSPPRTQTNTPRTETPRNQSYVSPPRTQTNTPRIETNTRTQNRSESISIPNNTRQINR